MYLPNFKFKVTPLLRSRDSRNAPLQKVEKLEKLLWMS